MPAPVEPAKRAVFYGWRIVVAGGVVFGTVTGLTFFSLGTYFTSWEQEFGWTRGQISTAISIAFTAGGIGAYIVGRIVDRIGPRIAIGAGGIVLALSLLAMSQITEYWQLLAALLVLATGRVTGAQPAVNVMIANWFVRKRGLASGLSRIGLSVLAFVAVPLSALLISTFGWRPALMITAGLLLVIIQSMVVFLIRNRPADLGLLPDGDRVPPRPASSHVTRVEPFELAYTARMAMATRAYWALLLALVPFFFAEVSINLHMVPFLTGRGNSLQEAATIAGALPASYMFGGLILGPVADRTSAKLVMSFSFVLVGSAISLLWFAAGTPFVWLFLPLFGLGAGAVLTLHANMIADLFGMKSYGAILGGLTGMMTTGVVLGPLATGFLYDQTGGYAAPFAIFVAMQIFAAVAVLFIRNPGPPKEARA